MTNPKVEIWEGPSLARAPEAGVGPPGFVRAAVLRWREEDEATGHMVRRLAAVWTGPGVAVTGSTGALTLSTTLEDGARVVTTNLVAPDVTIPTSPDAEVARVDGDVAGAHAGRVAALCAARGTAPRPVVSWRDAPLVLALGERTADAAGPTLAALRSGRWLVAALVAVRLLPVLLTSASMLAAGRWTPPDRMFDALEPVAAGGAVLAAMEAYAWYLRRKILALVPELEEGASSATARLIGSTYRFWLLPEPHPQIEALSVATAETRATIAAVGFTRCGAIRKKADFGRNHPELFQPGFDRLRAGRAVLEAWMEPGGLALCWVDAIEDEPYVEFLTLLADATLIKTVRVGPRAFRELARHLVTVPSAGVYVHISADPPGAEAWASHQRHVAVVCAVTGSTVVPVHTLDDALFLHRLSNWTARRAGAHSAAAAMSPWPPSRHTLVLLGGAVALSLATAREIGIAALVQAVGLVLSMVVGSFAARATAPKNRTLAELRALPVAPAPDGAVGHWLE